MPKTSYGSASGRSQPSAATCGRDCAQMGVYSTDRHANFLLPALGRRWCEQFDDTALQVRGYADGSARITIGSRQSTRAGLGALALR